MGFTLNKSVLLDNYTGSWATLYFTLCGNQPSVTKRIPGSNHNQRPAGDTVDYLISFTYKVFPAVGSYKITQDLREAANQTVTFTSASRPATDELLFGACYDQLKEVLKTRYSLLDADLVDDAQERGL